jgi:predicted transcriptional regulator YdeE
MDTISLDKDITVFCVRAASFPDGIMGAYERLRLIIGENSRRRIFGLSRPENGTIVYRAAAEESHPGEGKELDFETIVIRSGKYVSETLHNYWDDLSAIGRVFDKLLANPDIDPAGYCVEDYFADKDVRCMVRLKD